jgi:hypothetical protein
MSKDGPPTPTKRSWLRFNIRTLLILMTLVGWLAATKPQVRYRDNPRGPLATKGLYSFSISWSRDGDTLNADIRWYESGGANKYEFYLSPASSIWPVLAIVCFLAWKAVVVVRAKGPKRSDSTD